MLLLVASSLAADVRSVSLAEAMELAAGASESVRIAQAELDAAAADRSAAVGGRLPSVNGSLAYNHTFLSEYDGLFEVDTATATTPYAGAAANPFADLPFGAADTWRVDVAASEVVYGGGRVRAQERLAAAGIDAAQAGLDGARAGLRLQVASAYFDAQLAAQLVDIAGASLAQSELTLQHAEAAFGVGRQPEFEVVRARVEVDAQRVVLIQQQRMRDRADLQLRQLLGVPGDTVLQLTTAVDTPPPAQPAPAGDERVGVRQAEAGVRAAEAGVKLVRSAGLPQVAASASLGFVAYPDDPLPPTEDWRTNLSAGAAVSVPIFNGGVTRAQVRSAQADAVAAAARAEQAREAAALDAQDALAALTAARAQWEASGGTVGQAERAYAIAEVRFREGLSTQAELSDARILLARARASRAQAGRDLQVAAARVQLLSDLPFSTW